MRIINIIPYMYEETNTILFNGVKYQLYIQDKLCYEIYKYKYTHLCSICKK